MAFAPRTHRWSVGLSGLLFLSALPLRAQPLAAAREIDELIAWMTGTFDSKEQVDLGGEAPAIRMVIVAVPKSLLSFGAPVLYREDAPVDRPDRPTRQRFLRFEQDAAGTILVRVFELKDPISAAGKWRDASDLGLFGKNDVRERAGCLLTIRRNGDEYDGGTTGTRCVSSIRGAAYSTTETKIWSDRIEEWSRGYDADRKQVWGPVKAPTRFVKRSTGIPSDASTPSAGAAPPAISTPAASPAPPPPVAPSKAKKSVEEEPDLPEASPRTAVDLRGIGPRDVFFADSLKSHPAAATVSIEGGGVTYRGVALAELLADHGILSDGAAARRVLASEVLIATGADDFVSVFSAEEIFLSRHSYFLAFERDGKPLGSDGPVMLVDLKSPSRSVTRLRSLEWRSLAPGSAKP